MFTEVYMYVLYSKLYTMVTIPACSLSALFSPENILLAPAERSIKNKVR